MRLIRLNTVVLPAPLGPIRVKTSPRFTSKLTLLTASTPPKRTLRGFRQFGVVTMICDCVSEQKCPQQEPPRNWLAESLIEGGCGSRQGVGFQAIRLLETTSAA